MAASAIAAFWAVTVVLIVVPGPDWAYAISSGLQGRVISAAGGIVLGYGIMTMVVAAGLREALQRLLLAVDRGDPLGTSDTLLELVPRPEVVDQQRLERDLGRFLARHNDTPAKSSVRMFGDLFRVVAHHGLSIPPELAAVFRALGTVEGTLEQLAPRFEFVTEARALASSYVTEQLRPDTVRQAPGEEFVAPLPILRRFPAADRTDRQRRRARTAGTQMSACSPTNATARSSPTCCTRSCWPSSPRRWGSWPCCCSARAAARWSPRPSACMRCSHTTCSS
ncbi:MAG TPA: hypothetical protein VFE49_01910 [Jiangellaceae bacterium]|jgi:predicted unusual protein kinase regulating ubiquinone biosynthesis (AarF/ABC1/UbiB family)|nr:hypothetical protein [Jiangellaceae bacterium]